MADRAMNDRATLVLEIRVARTGQARDILITMADMLSRMAREQGWDPHAYRVYVEGSTRERG